MSSATNAVVLCLFACAALAACQATSSRDDSDQSQTPTTSSTGTSRPTVAPTTDRVAATAPMVAPPSIGFAGSASAAPPAAAGAGSRADAGAATQPPDAGCVEAPDAGTSAGAVEPCPVPRSACVSPDTVMFFENPRCESGRCTSDPKVMHCNAGPCVDGACMINLTLL